MFHSIIVQLLMAASSLPVSVSADEVNCFAPDGKTLADNETYVPCNKLGITQEGVYSSCCNLDGKSGERDLCTTTGLCLNKGILFRGYCSDKSWESDACVKVCMDEAVRIEYSHFYIRGINSQLTPQGGGSSNGTVEITPCTDGKYCCGHNNLNCCGTDRAFELPTLVNVKNGNVTQTAIVTVTAIAESATFKNATIGLAVVLGVVALIAAGAVFALHRKNLALHKQLDDRHQAPAPAPAPSMAQSSTPGPFRQSEIDPYQDFGPGSTITSASVYGGTPPYHNKAVSSIPPSSPGLSEAPTHMRYSELDATHASKNEAPS
jgi:hypothetical protein